ncbi:MAG: hypothetical protein ACLRTQ_01935 [Candidatus Borkfalkia sp.]
MGTKKMGRPTDSPKTNNTRIRLSDEDLAKLEFCKEKTGKTYADIIREGIDKVYQELKK